MMSIGLIWRTAFRHIIGFAATFALAARRNRRDTAKIGRAKAPSAPGEPRQKIAPDRFRFCLAEVSCGRIIGDVAQNIY